MGEDAVRNEEQPEAEDVEFQPREAGALPWFKFWANRWIGSSTVQRMPMTARGIYITLLAYQWMLGSLPRDPYLLGKLLGVDCRTAGKWLETYSDLTADLQEDSSYFTLPKLEELSVLLKKSTPDRAGEENRRDKKRIDSSSAPRKAKHKGSAGTGSERLPGLSQEECDRFEQGYGRADCPKCEGRGNYFLDDPAVTPVPQTERCECIPEAYR
jgi:hypothetical protein